MRILCRIWGYIHIVIGAAGLFIEVRQQMWVESVISLGLIGIGYVLVKSPEPEKVFERFVKRILLPKQQR